MVALLLPVLLLLLLVTSDITIIDANLTTATVNTYTLGAAWDWQDVHH